MNRNIRDLENMPLKIKCLYSKILSTMVYVDDSYNQLKLAEFYRIISKIQLPIKTNSINEFNYYKTGFSHNI